MLKSVYLEGRIFEEFSERICLQSICYASYLKKLHGGCFSEMKRVENYFHFIRARKSYFSSFFKCRFSSVHDTLFMYKHLLIIRRILGN